jgi:hypothetical protein
MKEVMDYPSQNTSSVLVHVKRRCLASNVGTPIFFVPVIDKVEYRETIVTASRISNCGEVDYIQ